MMFKPNQKLAIILIALLILSSCFTNPDNKRGGFLKDVSPHEAQRLIRENSNNENFVIIDIRTPTEYATEYIEKAINIDYYAENFKTRLNELDKSNTYLIYCRSGRRSNGASSIMDELGFEKVYNLSSGITGWKAAGYATVSEH